MNSNKIIEEVEGKLSYDLEGLLKLKVKRLWPYIRISLLNNHWKHALPLIFKHSLSNKTIYTTIGYSNNWYASGEVRELTHSNHERKIRIRNEKGNQKTLEVEGVL